MFLPIHRALAAGPLLASLGLATLCAAASGDAAAPAFEQVQPLLKEFCLNCHSTEKQKGDLDLEVFTSLESIKRHPKIWQGVAEQLENREMPPKNKPQPSPEQRAQLSRWTAATLAEMARERAGDPGPVVLRRLSNAEYTYTVRDLTGVESLDPAREFPTDGAAGEGFTNTGQALVMSPALLTKYLDAGKAIAAHAVLLPDGLRFSPSTNKRDWTEEILSEIRGFYRRFTEAGGGEQVNLQGIKFETNGGGRLPVEKYLGALLKNRDALAARRETVEALAAREGLNAKYTALLWQSLTADVSPQTARATSWLMDDLRTRWRAAKPGDEKALAEQIAAWQKALWKFNTVGYVGVPGKATGWMEPANPLLTRQEFKLKLPPLKPDETVTLYLVSTPVGVGSSKPGVVWERPRLTAKGRPEVLVHDLTPQLFGSAPAGETLDAASLFAPASGVIKIQLSAEAANGADFVVTARLAANPGEARVQVDVLTTPPPWETIARELPKPAPLLVAEGAAFRAQYEQAFAAFRELFPAALCYEKIIPSDEVVTLLQFYREDRQLARLMLSDAEQAHLDRLWTALRFITRDPLTQVDALLQIIEYATQDSDPKPFRAARPAFEERAAAFRQALLDAEPRQLDAVLELADRAYRRPLRDPEKGRAARALSQAADRRAAARGSAPAHHREGLRFAGVSLSLGKPRARSRPGAGHRRRAREPALVFPLVVAARCRAARSRRLRPAARTRRAARANAAAPRRAASAPARAGVRLPMAASARLRFAR